MSIDQVVKAIAVTAELTGANLSGTAIAVMATDLLERHSAESVMWALSRCRRELSRPLTAGAVFERLSEDDGRPGADEAWAIALLSADEAETVVWNQEIRNAMSAARPILDAGDKVGARMAFRDAYERIVRGNREAGVRPVWEPSLGWDKERRVVALESAVERGLLPAPRVAGLLPNTKGGVIHRALFGDGAVPDGDEGERVAGWVERIKRGLREARQARLDRQEANAKAQRDDLAARKERAAELVRKGLEKYGDAGLRDGKQSD